MEQLQEAVAAISFDVKSNKEVRLAVRRDLPLSHVLFTGSIRILLVPPDRLRICDQRRAVLALMGTYRSWRKSCTYLWMLFVDSCSGSNRRRLHKSDDGGSVSWQVGTDEAGFVKVNCGGSEIKLEIGTHLRFTLAAIKNSTVA